MPHGRNRDPSHPKRSVPWAAVVVLIVIAYPLSAGPAVWLQMRGAFGPGVVTALEAFYWPLARLADLSQAGRELLNWYVFLWMP